VTVLSRCQRFDLRRIEPEVMMALMRRIAEAEGAAIAEDALALIVRAAEGSARDATSLLDQAISHGAGETTAGEVRAMLGLADRGRVLDLFDMVMRGEAAAALAELSAQYAEGADPLAVLRDLAEITHWVSVIKITPEAAADPAIGPDERSRGLAMAETLPMRALTRMWQMLLKALEEVALSPNAVMAAEMAVIRLTHVADLPSPEDLVRRLQDEPPRRNPAGPSGGGAGAPAGGGGNGSGGSTAEGAAVGGGGSRGPGGQALRSGAAGADGGAGNGDRGEAGRAPDGARSGAVGAAGRGGGAIAALAPEHEAGLARFARFEDVVELIRARRDVKLLVEVEAGVRLVSYSPGRIAFVPGPEVPADLAQRLGAQLQGWTGARWAVIVERDGGAPSIAEARAARSDALAAEALEHPLVQAVLEAFPAARIAEIRARRSLEAEAAEAALPEVDEEWDPFEDE
jgi:DNA polymerase-3 subunit gamma/tau